MSRNDVIDFVDTRALRDRRWVLKAGMTCGLGLALGQSVPAAQDDRASERPKQGDWLVRAGDEGLTPLTPEDIAPPGRQTLAWAMDPRDKTVRSGSRLNRILLLRLDPERLSTETRLRAAAGVVAYTAICTHNGCEVVDWLADEQVLSCPCHSAKYDPADGAKVVDGPAPRPLPALPLTVVEARLVVAGSFTARIGFEPA